MIRRQSQRTRQGLEADVAIANWKKRASGLGICMAVCDPVRHVQDLSSSRPENVTVFLGAVFLTIYSMIGCIRGTRGSNEYGADPLSRSRLQKV
jgi:hypothetical protein